MSLSTRTPSGRAELLGWINQCCGMYYPAVEALRDGAAYCLVVEACLQRAAAQSKKSGASSTTTILEQRANLASKLLQRVDWEARNFTTVQSAASKDLADPSLDSIQLRDACERNFQVLQDVLRRCVPKDHTLEIDSKRLSAGKLQEHVRLLQWMHAFSVKMAKAFPADSVKLEVPSSSTANQGPRVRSKSAGGASEARKGQHTDAQQSTDYAAERYLPNAGVADRSPQPHARRPEQAAQESSGHSMATLVAKVEALEAEAAKATTEDSRETDADVTIGDLKALLDERDVLWQTLSMIEQIVEAERDRTSRTASSVPTPLLVETAAIFGIQLHGRT